MSIIVNLLWVAAAFGWGIWTGIHISQKAHKNSATKKGEQS